MNVAIAKIYEIVNGLSKFKVNSDNDERALGSTLQILIRIIEPMIPHLAEELWALGNNGESIINAPWPKVDPSFMEQNEVIVVIQINGKRRAEINIAKTHLKKLYLIKLKISKILTMPCLKKI